MKVHTATLAGSERNADRVFVTEHAAILLDGASAFAPVDIDPGDYADALGEAIAGRLDVDPARDLSGAVADAICQAAATLQLGAGPSPSSTVAIVRVRDSAADLYVLGDSPLYYGTRRTGTRLVDDRLANLTMPDREKYRTALALGAGYTEQHRATLAALQVAQRERRNRPGGYWIAETDPEAARQARTATVSVDQIEWAVLASDGAADVIEHLHRPAWSEVAQLDADELTALLTDLHEWETTTDPDGRLLHRAKRHDDKTVAAIPILW